MYIVAEGYNEDWIYFYLCKTIKEAIYLLAFLDMIQTERICFYAVDVVENDEISVSINAKSLEEFLGLVLKVICEERGYNYEVYDW